MKINYNHWFYDQHKYTEGTRDGVVGYNDTKWKNMNQRLQKLTELDSELIRTEAFGVVGNYTGLDKLVNLLDHSNYTFQDLNDALADTYRISFKNAMSRMVVNTHAIIMSIKSTDKKIGSTGTKYYVIDVPYDQLSYGDRDETVRQNIEEMYSKSRGNYIPMERFIGEDITKLLGFTLLVTTNGFIANDWMVAFDEKGFHFKVAWTRPEDCTFIIYKLDKSFVKEVDLSTEDTNNIKNANNPDSYFIPGNFGMDGTKCIVNIFDPSKDPVSMGAANFGIVRNGGIEINGLQKWTSEDLKRYGTTNARVIVYGIPMLFEIPFVYPAINYYDMMYSKPVYTEKNEDVCTDTGRVIGYQTRSANPLTVCTPPISVDREVSESFNTVLECVGIKNTMSKYTNSMLGIGTYVNKNSLMPVEFNHHIWYPAMDLFAKIEDAYKTFLQGAILTSLVPDVTIQKFEDFVNRFRTFVEKISADKTLTTAKRYAIDEFYGENYNNLVIALGASFDNRALQVFNTIDRNVLTRTYLEEYDVNTRINRPISEQCFISLKWNTDEECWVFVDPRIRHFHGIQNTFYIDKEYLRGNEVFKFFIVYTDTDAPGEKNVETIPFEDIFDYDKFNDEVESHLGYIKYWNVENHLQKLAKIYYGSTDTDYHIQILSEILQGKIEGEELLEEYISNMNYEPSNATTDNINAGETDERGPFSINFLFYTLASMFDNEDKLLSYLMNKLTSNKFINRYSDIDISSMMSDSDFALPVNFSMFTQAPTTFDVAKVDIPAGQAPYYFYGLPMIVDGSGTSLLNTPYRYSFNRINSSDIKFPLVSDGKISYEYSASYTDAANEGYSEIIYSYDLIFAKMILEYIDRVYDYINFLETDYTKTLFVDNALMNIRDLFYKQLIAMEDYIENKHLVESTSATIKHMLFDDDDNILINNLKEIMIATVNIRKAIDDKPIQDFFDDNLIYQIKNVYINNGFDDYGLKRIRALYLHLKKINSPMNLPQFVQWVNEIDMDTVNNLENMLAANAVVDIPNDIFNTYAQKLNTFLNGLPDKVERLSNAYDELKTTVQTDHIDILLAYCSMVLSTYYFDLYSISKVSITETSLSDKPLYAIANIDPTDSHFYPPTEAEGTAGKIIFIVDCVSTADTYVIKRLNPICDYTFFNGTDYTFSNIELRSDQNSVIGTIDATVSFVKVGNTAQLNKNVTEAPLISNSLLKFNNVHTRSYVDNNVVINESRAAMNYELLAGNHFKPLESYSVYTLNRETKKKEAMDNVVVPNILVNGYAKEDYGYRNGVRMFFKPVQVMHLEPDENNVITSVGYGYTVGQRVYVYTPDYHVFPVIVTAIDHSINHGIIEAIVDYQNADWFEETDSAMMEYLLTGPIECTIIPDNICNFLDTYSNGEYKSYYYPATLDVDLTGVTSVTLPGDPIFVLNNPDYVYTRIQWIFNETVPNRFIDEQHKMYDFIYIGNTNIDSDSPVLINCINHNFNKLTLPELYPVLRDEPNDHYVHQQERTVYAREIQGIKNEIFVLEIELENSEKKYAEATTMEDRMKYKIEIDEYLLKIDYQKKFMDRLESWLKQAETPTTWYNVAAYDDALVYINNGRAKMIGTPIFNVRDIDYTDAIEVLLYDWANKNWIDPSSYTVTINTVDNIQIDPNVPANTDNIMNSITITFSDISFYSSDVLIYFAYKKSDVFDSITSNADTLNIRFKPAMIIDNNTADTLYDDIKIRKHFDTNESYKFTEYSTVEDFSLSNCYYIKRIRRSGRYPFASIVRLEDITATSGGNTYDYTGFDIYQRFPFKCVDMDHHVKTVNYDVLIRKSIDGFVENQPITLICINTNAFDGSISTIIFNGITGLSGTSPTITITDSNIGLTEGTFTCTVAADPSSPMAGGVVEITSNISQSSAIMDPMFKWYKLPTDKPFRIVSDEIILVPRNTVTIVGNTIEITFRNVYDVDYTSTLNDHVYYYDPTYDVRYPMSDVRRNDPDTRTVVDETLFPDVQKIKSNYIGVCRYSSEKIPQNGIINLTGYIPTPLSRDRYEFWVNGRCLNNSDKLVILSPTAIQLKNLTSLRNFEVIELVDDKENSAVTPTGTVYVDLEGNIYGSYLLALASNKTIRYQYLKYRFYTNDFNNLDTYTNSIIHNPNNHDIETDILSYITDPNEVITDYNELYNLPTLNGATLKHPMTIDLGITEVPAEKLLSEYDRVWKYEISTNPYFPISHRDSISSNRYVGFIIKKLEDDSFEIHITGICNEYFTLYITNDESSGLTSAEKIIPMIKVGVAIVLDSSFNGKWIHATFNSTPTLIE